MAACCTFVSVSSQSLIKCKTRSLLMHGSYMSVIRNNIIRIHACYFSVLGFPTHPNK